MNVFVLNPGSEQTRNVIRDLIYGCWCKGKRIGGMKTPPLNLLHIATILKDAGHKVYFRDALAEGIGIDKLTGVLKQTDIVIINTSTMTFAEDCGVLSRCKKVNKNIKTIIFGSHPTFMPEESLTGPIDFIVRKEPEFIIRDLVNALSDGSYKDVKGIGYRKDGKVVLTEDYGFPDIDDLPIPDRTLLPKDVDYFNPLTKKIPYTTMVTSRGCPALCTFCTVPTFYGNKIRARSKENVIKELEIIKKQGYKEVWIRDETFTVYKKRNREICQEMIDRKLNLSWMCNARIGSIDKETMALMKKAGCHMIKFGVESGVQKILDNVRKGIKVTQTVKTFRWAHEVGIDTHAHMMLGMPGDSRRTIEKTIEFVKKIDPTTVSFAICTPYAGTPLFDEVKKKNPGIMDGTACNLKGVHETSFYNQHFTSLTDKEISSYLKKAYRSFYFRPSYLFRWLLRIRNMDELRRVILAGSNVFSFSFEK